MAVLSFSGMPYALAEQNMRLFAEKVMPALKASGIAAVYTPEDMDLNRIMAELVDIIRNANGLAPYEEAA